MTTDHEALCEKLNEDGQFEASALIEAQAKQIAELEAQLEREARKIQEAMDVIGLTLSANKGDRG